MPWEVGVFWAGFGPLVLWYIGKGFVRQIRKRRREAEVDRRLLYKALMDMPVGSSVRVGILLPKYPHYGDKAWPPMPKSFPPAPEPPKRAA
jgi:hypothetical protein